MNLSDVRPKLVAAIAPRVEEPPLHDNQVDAITAPCMFLGWRTPMVDGWNRCGALAYPQVTLVGGRLEVAAAIGAIEEMYDRLQRRLREAGGAWVIMTDSGIVERSIGNVAYLTCRVDVRVPIEL